MRKLFLYIAIMAVSLLVACSSNTDNPNGTDYINLDQLEKYKMITSNSLVYSEEDIQELALDESLRDYEVVIKKYVAEKLGHTVSYLDTVDGTYNPRKVVVGTQEGDTFLLELRKWYNYNEIWTVASHSQFNANNEALPPELIAYEQVTPQMVTDVDIQQQINTYIASGEEGQYYFQSDEVFYILIVAEENQSVELLHLFGNASLINVEYAYVDSSNEQYGAAPYRLLKVNEANVMDLLFKEYSTVKVRDERLNLN